MTFFRFSATSVLAALWLVGCGKDVVSAGTERTPVPEIPVEAPEEAVPSVDMSPAALEGLAFEMLELPSDGVLKCRYCSETTVLVARASASRIELVWGAAGRATPLVLAPGTEWTSEEPVRIGQTLTWSYARCADSFELQSGASFEFADFNGDGKIDLDINGIAEVTECSDDYFGGRLVKTRLRGRQQRRAAELFGEETAADPLKGIHLEVDPPLEMESSAVFSREDGGPPTSLSSRLSNGYIVGFDSDEVLSFGQKYLVSVEGRDFVGGGAPQSVEYVTMDDFGLFSSDGFESGSLLGVSGGKLVTEFGVAALFGTQMLRIEPGLPVFFHMTRNSGKKKLIFSTRLVNECETSEVDFLGSLDVRIGVVGSSGITTETVPMTSVAEEVVVDGRTLRIGEMTQVTLNLPEVEGTDLIVSLTGPDYAGIGCQRLGALVDNVALE